VSRFKRREAKSFGHLIGHLPAGVRKHRPPKACRHTFATWAIESGEIPLQQLAKIMGTSVDDRIGIPEGLKAQCG
jgi:integrase